MDNTLDLIPADLAQLRTCPPDFHAFSIAITPTLLEVLRRDPPTVIHEWIGRPRRRRQLTPAEIIGEFGRFIEETPTGVPRWQEYDPTRHTDGYAQWYVGYFRAFLNGTGHFYAK